VELKRVLVELEKLLQNWRINTSGWILVSQYAYRLLGYDVKLRKGHLNVLVRKNKIPWKIKEGIEIHPPRKTKYRAEFEKFIDKTGFDFDINLATDKEFTAKEGFYVLYKLPNSTEIRVQKPSGAIKEFEKLLSLSTKEGLGTERLNKDIFYIKDMILALSKKGEEDTTKLFQRLLKKYLTVKKKHITVKPTDTDSIAGIVASKGKANGRIIVVYDIKDAKLIKDGDILVTKMTSPILTLLLPKISAIVTDKGGMLSHAAILAREIGVPCIVGTQVATKVLKDGDLVEVDAYRGIVRKI